MNCEDRDEWLGRLACTDLPFDQEMVAAQHLEGCATCRAESEKLKELVKWLPPAAAPPARRRVPWWMAAAAATLLIGFTVGRVSVPTASLPRSQPVAAQSPAPAPPLFTPEVRAYLDRGLASLTPSERNSLRFKLKRP